VQRGLVVAVSVVLAFIGIATYKSIHPGTPSWERRK